MTVWTQLSHDPRRAGIAGLRASDADRGVVQAVLSQAYADGRLTPVEHDERITMLWRATTLGELRGLLADLVPEADPLAPTPPRRPGARRLAGFLVPSIACLLLWRLAAPGLFWPAWVIVYTGMPLLRRR